MVGSRYDEFFVLFVVDIIVVYAKVVYLRYSPRCGKVGGRP